MSENHAPTVGSHTVYPVVQAVKQEEGTFLMQCIASGMTVRQHMATEAMKGLSSRPWDNVEELAARAVEQADALIAALNKGIETQEEVKAETTTVQ